MKLLHSLSVSVLICALALSCSNQKSGSDSDEPLHKKNQSDESAVTSYYPKSENVFRIVTYNVGSFSKYLDNSTQMVSDMLKEIEADFVGMNEVDSCNTRHMTNQALDLAAKMGNGWNWHFGRAMAYKSGAYGNAIVTSAKLLDKYDVVLEKGSGSEQRGLAVVETDKFIFGQAHLDHKSDEAQISQAEIITKWAASQKTDKPIFFAGDMNAYPNSKTLSYLTTNWEILSSTGNTFPSNSATNCIDYVFHYKPSASVTVKGSQVMTRFVKGDVTKASDHLPVYVDVELK